ncbi:glycosyltransferase family 39 protein, partial [bacterium]|nr:glycosyltransferase family 39 protein [candidate division CSSED10-310 bacterium]
MKPGVCAPDTSGMPGPGRRLYLFLFILALLLRLWNLYQFISRDPVADFLILDGWSYDRTAQQILTGSFWGEGVFFQDPLYPYFLAGIYAAAGHSLTAVKVVQAVLGAVTVVCIAGIAAQVAGLLAGLAAGLLAAWYPTFIFYDCLIMKEGPGLFFTTAAFFVLVRLPGSNRIRRFLAAGMLFGLAVMTRGNLMLFIPFLLAWIACTASGGATARIRAALAVALGCALILAPVTIRNRVVGGEWVLLTAQGGANLFIGNNPYSDGAAARPPYLRMSPEFEEDDFRHHAEQALGRSLTAKEINAYWKRQALAFITSQPREALALTFRKARLFFNYYEIPDNYNLYFYRRYSALLYNPIGYGVVLVLALTGMVVLVHQWRRLSLLYLIVPVYAGSVIMFHVYARYRLSIVPFLIVFAAALLRQLYCWVLARRWGPVVFAGLTAVILIPLVFRQESHYSMARSHFMRGLGLAGQGRDVDAAVEYEDAIRIDPEFARAYNNLAKLRFLRGDRVAAEALWLKALDCDPELAEA